ncbi:dihydrodipicolinate synthetase [Cryptococcus gattii E566]|uniref:Dihydrodipicolinate synthetase n=2 Tax=Cryptococcus gattii TaxID=37769 RepID=E6R9A8_CRYGW|nr:uncharacterized protein CGB_G2440W [Cryptococcus gattii WM276]ADV23388.1 Conserved hypothetical protein [Cryptococcus gattii WM276]KIR77768.1 dihydrodipicolinate synthetase [Cryptococcus gattii EJB2]KIY35799.1 dihydrodipicolinate synthetase [Cryptococcus gattii E566]KJE01471.1 dihydrodipicolinate synthetase [Cryptococcus gattii NT-10]
MSSLNGHSNGNGATHKRVLRPGVWAPIPTFLDGNEELDIATFRKHVVELAKIGMQPVICGSMGEAFHLADNERVTLFKETRAALDEAGLFDTVVIAGTGANSTRATINLCHLAASSGADVAIVIPPGYYAGAMSPLALKTFFLEVQASSPIPVMVYNYPGAAGGIDLSSDLIAEVAREGSNICGVKLTCGAVGKLTRITAATATPAFANYPRKSDVAPEFLTLGGFADFLAPAMLGGRGHGAIMGLGNIYPRSLVRLFELSHKIATDAQPSAQDLKKALELQDLVSGADASFSRAGIAGTKWYLKTHSGYPSARLRHPLLEFTDEQGRALEKEEAVVKLMEVEKSLRQ